MEIIFIGKTEFGGNPSPSRVRGSFYQTLNSTLTLHTVCHILEHCSLWLIILFNSFGFHLRILLNHFRFYIRFSYSII